MFKNFFPKIVLFMR